MEDSRVWWPIGLVIGVLIALMALAAIWPDFTIEDPGPDVGVDAPLLQAAARSGDS
ncbi:hypothetical protein [Planomonospora sp. ID82291]|uniref:hypothetical protein n=1 Tax=Planomonospora sp. ID82291 TaxID=2738136 RepID=UPI0018C40CC7|nr:hypothetical protein [Planomonospora sp. ID82291]MBG0818771.1 hypothetical protein [Planomonospora sp. ID82291]